MLREKLFFGRKWQEKEVSKRIEGCTSQQDDGENLHKNSSPQSQIDSFLLTGPAKTGKTSLLYSLACEHAQENLTRPYSFIVTQKQAFEEKFPLLYHIHQEDQNIHSPPYNYTREYFRYIQLSYNENIQDLMRTLSSLQFFPHLPSLIMVDNLSSIIDPSMRLARSSMEFLDHACRILSYLYDASSSCGCHEIIITDSCEVSEYLHLLRQFASSHLRCYYRANTSTYLHYVEFYLVSVSPSIFLARSIYQDERLELSFVSDEDEQN